jgi:integrase
MEPSQIVGDVWTIPMTKNGLPHAVPLSATAAMLAAEGWPRREYRALHAYLAWRDTPWRVHDVRRTAATRMRDAGVAREVIEAVLNHAPPRLVRTYQRPNMMPAMRVGLNALESTVLALVAGK